MAKANGETITISISIDGKIIDIADKCAGIEDLSRSKLIERAIKKYLQERMPEIMGRGNADYWKQVYTSLFNSSC